MKTGTLNTLELMSKEEGKHMDSPESVKVLTASASVQHLYMTGRSLTAHLRDAPRQSRDGLCT